VLRWRRGDDVGVSVPWAALVLAGLAGAVAVLRAANLAKWHTDSVTYLMAARMLADGSYRGEVSTQLLTKRTLGVPLLHAPATLGGEFYLRSITALITTATLVTLVWLLRRGLGDAVSDRRQLVFESARHGNTTLYIINVDGTGERHLTTTGYGDDTHPQWSPDGQTILFDSDRDGDDEVYVMDADGRNVRRLTYSPRGDGHASWSPDGTRIIFGSAREGNSDIWTMRADGTLDDCDVTVTIGQDTFRMSGPFDPATGGTLTITGGTGAWIGAAGTDTIVNQPNGQAIHTIELLVR